MLNVGTFKERHKLIVYRISLYRSLKIPILSINTFNGTYDPKGLKRILKNELKEGDKINRRVLILVLS